MRPRDARAPPAGALQRDVADTDVVLLAPGQRGKRPAKPGAGLPGTDHFVDVPIAGRGRRAQVPRGIVVRESPTGVDGILGRGQVALMDDPDRLFRAHDPELALRPASEKARAEALQVHVK